MRKIIWGGIKMKRIQVLLEAHDEKDIWDTVKYLSQNKKVHMELLEDDITNVLIDLGISSGLKGFSYLFTAVELCINNRDMLNNITKNLYPEIAKRHCVNGVKVEHAIRHAIQRAWMSEENRIRKIVFGNTASAGTKPTNAAFIAAITDYIELRKI